MSDNNYGGLVLRDGQRYFVRIMDLFQDGSVAVKGYPDGLYMNVGCSFINKSDITWTVRNRGGGTFALQCSDGRWVLDDTQSYFVLGTDQSKAAIFTACSAGAPNIGVLRLQRTGENTIAFCGLTGYYQMNSSTYVPDKDFLSEPLSRNGNFMPGKYIEFFFLKELQPRKTDIKLSNSAFFESDVRNTNATRFRLMFTPA